MHHSSFPIGPYLSTTNLSWSSVTAVFRPVTVDILVGPSRLAVPDVLAAVPDTISVTIDGRSSFRPVCNLSFLWFVYFRVMVKCESGPKLYASPQTVTTLLEDALGAGSTLFRIILGKLYTNLSKWKWESHWKVDALSCLNKIFKLDQLYKQMYEKRAYNRKRNLYECGLGRWATVWPLSENWQINSGPS